MGAFALIPSVATPLTAFTAFLPDVDILFKKHKHFYCISFIFLKTVFSIIILFLPREKNMDAKCIIEMEGKRTSILNLKVVFIHE